MLEQIIEYDKQITLSINNFNSPFFDNVMYIGTQTWFWLPLFIVLIYCSWEQSNNWKQLALVLLAVALCVFVADRFSSGLIKPLVCRWRPTHDPTILQFVHIVNGYRGGSYGFFSSHAANTMSIAIFLSYLYRKKIVTVILFSWSIFNCYTRMYLGVHFFGDIICGLIWGFIVGETVAFFFEKYLQKPLYCTKNNSLFILLTFITELFCLLIVALFCKI